MRCALAAAFLAGTAWAVAPTAAPYSLTTLAGGQGYDYIDGTGTSAQFKSVAVRD